MPRHGGTDDHQQERRERGKNYYKIHFHCSGHTAVVDGLDVTKSLFYVAWALVGGAGRSLSTRVLSSWTGGVGREGHQAMLVSVWHHTVLLVDGNVEK